MVTGLGTQQLRIEKEILSYRFLIRRIQCQKIRTETCCARDREARRAGARKVVFQSAVDDIFEAGIYPSIAGLQGTKQSNEAIFCSSWFSRCAADRDQIDAQRGLS